MSVARKKGVSLFAGAGIVIATFGYLVYGGLDSNLVYFVTPTELSARGVQAVDKPVRLGGDVKPGSIIWDAESLDLRFHLTDGETDMLVHSKGAPPQMFRDGMGVVVEGKLSEDAVFHSTNLMIKHSNEYHPPKEGERPHELYEDLMRGDGSANSHPTPTRPGGRAS